MDTSGCVQKHLNPGLLPSEMFHVSTPSESKEKLFYWESNGALARVGAQKGCGVSSLESFESCLDVVLGTLLWVALLDQRCCQPQPL